MAKEPRLQPKTWVDSNSPSSQDRVDLPHFPEIQGVWARLQERVFVGPAAFLVMVKSCRLIQSPGRTSQSPPFSCAWLKPTRPSCPFLQVLGCAVTKAASVHLRGRAQSRILHHIRLQSEAVARKLRETKKTTNKKTRRLSQTAQPICPE